MAWLRVCIGFTLFSWPSVLRDDLEDDADAEGVAIGAVLKEVTDDVETALLNVET